jgi:hypothetical protein
LGVQPASSPTIEISKDTSLLLEAISDLGKRLSSLEEQAHQSPLLRSLNAKAKVNPEPKQDKVFYPLDKNNRWIEVGSRVKHPSYGEGFVILVTGDSVTVNFADDDGIMFSVGKNEAKELEIIATD